MLQRHVLLHGVVEAVLLLPCTPRTLLQFIGTPTQRAQASLHCWLAGLLQATSRPRPITFHYTNTRAHSLNRRTHCFVPLPTHSSPRTTSPSPTVAVDQRAPQPPNYVLSTIGASIGRVRHARKLNSLSALGHSYFSYSSSSTVWRTFPSDQTRFLILYPPSRLRPRLNRNATFDAMASRSICYD